MDDATLQTLKGAPAREPRDVFEEMLLGRKTVPVLRDGTPLSELIDIRKREIKLRVFDDAELHQMEMDKVWARVWIPVCHETDLPQVGDFKRGYIGEDRVIVTRAADRSINVMLDVCSHRAMEVCWSDEGNTKQFKCPYHGWVFDLKGKLLGAPFEKEEYGDWDKSQYPLKAAKVAQRHGVYFATFNPNPPSLEDYLTEFVGFFDYIFGSHEMVSMGMIGNDLGLGIIPANWKAVAEQNCGDGYHTATLHHSLVELGLKKGGDPKAFSLDCCDTSSTGGHGLRVVEIASSVYAMRPDEEAFPFGWFIAGSMFPSCGVGMNATWIETKGGSKIPMYTANLGARAPKGHAEATSSGFGMTLMSKEAHEAMMLGDIAASRTRRPGIPFFMGAVGNDDPESWMSETRVARGSVTRRETIKYNALEGASNPPELPEGLGLVHRGMSKDDNQWHFWLAYYDWMTRE